MTTRTLPWSRAGTELASPVSTVEEALTEAGLDWEVELRKAGRPNAKGNWVVIPDRFAAVRSDTDEYLGTVGKHYVPVSNRQALQIATDLAAEGGITHAWAEGGGKKVGVAVKYGDPIDIYTHEDPIQLYMSVTTGHDGKHSVRAAVWAHQLACMNMLPDDLQEDLNVDWQIIHVGSVSERLAAAAAARDVVAEYRAVLGDELARLARTSVTDAEFNSIVKASLKESYVYGKSIEKTAGAIVDLRGSSETMSDEIRSTAAGCLHATTEYWDHRRSYMSDTAAFRSAVGTNGYGRRCRNAVVKRLQALAA